MRMETDAMFGNVTCSRLPEAGSWVQVHFALQRHQPCQQPLLALPVTDADIAVLPSPFWHVFLDKYYFSPEAVSSLPFIFQSSIYSSFIKLMFSLSLSCLAFSHRLSSLSPTPLQSLTLMQEKDWLCEDRYNTHLTQNCSLSFPPSPLLFFIFTESMGGFSWYLSFEIAFFLFDFKCSLIIFHDSLFSILFSVFYQGSGVFIFFLHANL